MPAKKTPPKPAATTTDGDGLRQVGRASGRQVRSAGGPNGQDGGRGRTGGRQDKNAAQPVSRTFPAGSYIVRMDQPYSRIADSLLDYQYWSPNDPQRTPYDDTGWTFPELFNVQAVRVADVKVLDAPVEKDQPACRAERRASTRHAVRFS